MAEDQDDSQKTEEPSQRRLEEALKKGQVIYSKEITNFLVLLVLTFSIIWSLPSLSHHTTLSLRYFIEHAGSIPTDEVSLGRLLLRWISTIGLLALIPMSAVTVIAIISGFLQQGGIHTSSEPLKPKLEKISPIKGFSRLFSMRSLVETAKNLIKLIFVGGAGFIAVYPELKHLLMMHDLASNMIIASGLHLIIRMLIALCVAMAALSILDFLYQRFEYYKGLRMSKQELKDEFKETEGNPEIKAKLRSLRIQRAKRRMMAAVPTADVVITNPTHFAIALSYQASTMTAPKVVAKGQDFLAHTLRQIAEKYRVPIIENPPLARALYDAVEVDEEIPATFYKAVAEIISYVYRLKGKLPK